MIFLWYKCDCDSALPKKKKPQVLADTLRDKVPKCFQLHQLPGSAWPCVHLSTALIIPVSTGPCTPNFPDHRCGLQAPPGLCLDMLLCLGADTCSSFPNLFTQQRLWEISQPVACTSHPFLTASPLHQATLMLSTANRMSKDTPSLVHTGPCRGDPYGILLTATLGQRKNGHSPGHGINSLLSL